ncbi:glycosyl hydrolase [Miniphocaeibacter halophilus]|uniref:Uncharacterized protein n=1 Tax=Miniphocaeibacter halophilus TaxID=2931922 RepID=A0AC61MTH8_9FIRM|nr:glycosyl hydrolase [Miniphocaeibacter halophilus]QQK09010.1 hypothetical protein JFY71_05590 [Miniphocaeibacter halophilus]
MSNLNKPYTRMWLYGLNITKDEIDYNIEQVKNKGIGGIELQFIYPIEEKGNKQFYSSEFFDDLNYFINRCHKENIDVDLTLGSGWPLGGKFIDKSMAPDILIPYQVNLCGPTNYNYDFTGVLSGKIVKATLAKIDNGKIIKDTLRDVTTHVKTEYIEVWPWGESIKDLNIPEGEHRLYVFVSNEYRQLVGKAAPNMEGYAMDHCRKDVTKLYLEQLGDVLLDNIDVTKIRSVFCDSIELTASNWTKYLLDDFIRERGYDLTPYLPALWDNIDDLSPYIRCDYYRTYGEATVNNYFKEIKKWAVKKGVQFRLQAHGTWGDIINAYSASHIPEGETFGYGDKLNVNINHRRLAVSSGMNINAPIVSNETYTWLRKPRFLVTLEMMKKATDACFVDGINHIINHGYSFYKGNNLDNIFYASTVISPHNTWWKYYNNLSEYISNTCRYLQSSKIKTNLAILTPTTDIWAKNTMAELHMSLKIEKHIGNNILNKLSNLGYWTAFVNDDRIQKSENVLKLETNEIDTLIVPSMDYIDLYTLRKIEQLSNTTNIIFLNKYPIFGHTYLNYVAVNYEIQDIIKRISSKKGVYLLNEIELFDNIGKIIDPIIKIENNDNVGFIIREDSKHNKIIFIANISDEYKEISIDFQFNNYFEIYDPMENNIYLNYDVKGNKILLDLEPNQSLIIKESNNLRENLGISKYEIYKRFEIKPKYLNIGMDNKIIDSFITWETIDDFKYYSGIGIYSSEFEISNELINLNAFLEIDSLFEICDVYINDKFVGNIWKKPYKLNITDKLHLGKNSIKFEVTNLLFNSALNNITENPRTKLSKEWPYLNEIIVQNRIDKVDTFREREENLGIQKSGIEGKVYLNFFKGKTVR